MKEILQQFAGYNLWANRLMTEKMCGLSDEVLDRAMTSSFQSLRETTYHCWSAEDIWLQRLNSVPSPIWAESIFKGSFQDACANWMVISTALEHFVTQSSEETLMALLSYKDLQQNEHQTPVSEILLHVFNHATYHRGQLVTLLRKAGETEIPRTDFIVFSRTVLHNR